MALRNLVVKRKHKRSLPAGHVIADAIRRYGASAPVSMAQAVLDALKKEGYKIVPANQ